MFSEEVKQVVYLAITCILLAVVLTFASRLMTVKNDMVNMRNGEILTGQQVKTAREFSKYNDTTNLTGVDVMEAISNYAGTNIVVLVGTDNSGTFTCYNETQYKTNASKYSLDTLQKLYVDNNTSYNAMLFTGAIPGTVSCYTNPSVTLSDLYKVVSNGSTAYEWVKYKWADGDDVKIIAFSIA